MIYLNDIPIDLKTFPDGTPLIKLPPEEYECGLYQPVFTWFFEGNEELVYLQFLTKHCRDMGFYPYHLILPYLPNARQDRVKNDEDVFTLKYFAEILNDMNFSTVYVLDPHSSVSSALINNIVWVMPTEYVLAAMGNIEKKEREKCLLFFPDEGAVKRYSELFPGEKYAFGIKQRDWSSGTINGLEISGAVDSVKGKNILIVDDICSRGGTFYHAAKKLKELGAKNIYLYVSHCEKTIFSGNLWNEDVIKMVYTTNSIMRGDIPLSNEELTDKMTIFPIEIEA